MSPEKGFNFFKALIQLIKRNPVAKTEDTDRAAGKTQEYFGKTSNAESDVDRVKRLLDKLRKQSPDSDEESESD